ncbi:AraC family transcriptional regulator [Allocoprobacillus halotolerans]|uniref:AraC family transcriptional regulator n=1 Tax=Allocoprobacillus halotolerans TaxID=2944914 RepID=A0ABY5I1Y7_9FIRM|nr:AraC family transcriptional regulator [Allocoprobacillus halotolerans]UTY39065.1 AraC family transcriptional regulator [Allocoprobacillus halotolerans]
MKEYKESPENLLYSSISDLSFYSAGYEQCVANHSWGPKLRSYQLIHFVLYGKGEFTINGHVFHLAKGDAFIIPSGKVCYYKADAIEPWCYVWINFSGIKSQIYAHELMQFSNDVFIIHDLDIDKYKNPIFEILKLNTNKTSRFLKCNSILLDIMSMLFENLELDDNLVNSPSIADEAKHYLDINYPEKIKIKDIAKELGVHPNYLTKVFHDKFGISPKNYLKNLKLKKAKSLLATTTLPISVIADSLGFDDQLAFSKTFKNKYNLSPSQFRKEETLKLNQHKNKRYSKTEFF